MEPNVWTCGVILTGEGRLAIELPEDLAVLIGISKDRTVEIAKARNKMFELWLSATPEEQRATTDALATIPRAKRAP